MDGVDQYTVLRPDIDARPVTVKRADSMDPKARAKARRTISMSGSAANKRAGEPQSGKMSFFAKIFRSRGKNRNDTNVDDPLQKNPSSSARQSSQSKVFRTRSTPTRRHVQVVSRKARSRRFQFTRDRRKNIPISDKHDSRAPTFIDRVDEKSMPTGLAGFGSMFSEVSEGTSLNDEAAEPANLDHSPMRLQRSTNIGSSRRDRRDGRESGSLQRLGITATVQTLDIAPLSIVDTVQTVDIEPKPTRSQSMTIERRMPNMRHADVNLTLSRSDKGLGKVLRFEDEQRKRKKEKDRPVQSIVSNTRAVVTEESSKEHTDSIPVEDEKPAKGSVQKKRSPFEDPSPVREDSALSEGVCVPMPRKISVQRKTSLFDNSPAPRTSPQAEKRDSMAPRRTSIQEKASLFEKTFELSDSSFDEMCGVPLKRTDTLAKGLSSGGALVSPNERGRDSSADNRVLAKASMFERAVRNKQPMWPEIEYSPVKKSDVKSKSSMISNPNGQIEGTESNIVESKEQLRSPSKGARTEQTTTVSIRKLDQAISSENVEIVDEVKDTQPAILKQEDIVHKASSGEETANAPKEPAVEKAGVLARTINFEEPRSRGNESSPVKVTFVEEKPIAKKASTIASSSPQSKMWSKTGTESRRTTSAIMERRGSTVQPVNARATSKRTRSETVNVRALVSKFEEDCDSIEALLQSGRVNVKAMASRFEKRDEQVKPQRSKTWNVLGRSSQLKKLANETKPLRSNSLASVSKKTHLAKRVNLEPAMTVTLDAISETPPPENSQEKLDEIESQPVDVVSDEVPGKQDANDVEHSKPEVATNVPRETDEHEEIAPSAVKTVDALGNASLQNEIIESTPIDASISDSKPTEEASTEPKNTEDPSAAESVTSELNVGSNETVEEETLVNDVKAETKTSTTGSIEAMDSDVDQENTAETPNLSRTCSPVRREIFKPLSPPLQSVEALELVTLNLSPKSSRPPTRNESAKPGANGEGGPPSVDIAKIINEYLAPKPPTAPSARNQLPASKASLPSNRRFLSISTPRRTVSYSGTIHKPQPVLLKRFLEKSNDDKDEEFAPGKVIDIIEDRSPLFVAKPASKQGIEALEMQHSSPSVSDPEDREDEISTPSNRSPRPHTSSDNSEAHRYSSPSFGYAHEDDDIAATPPTITRIRRRTEESRYRSSSPAALNLDAGFGVPASQGVPWRRESSRGNLTSQVAPNICTLPAHYEAETLQDEGTSTHSSEASFDSPACGVVEQVITALARAHSLLDNRAVRRAYMCSDFDLLYSERSSSGWESGHLCASSMISSLLLDGPMRFKLHEAGISSNLSIGEVSRRIEQAWAAGFDVDGAAKYSGRLVGRRAYLGATEVAVLLISSGIPAQTRAFPANTPRERRLFFDWVLAHFERCCSNSGGGLRQQRRQRDSRDESVIVPLFISWRMRACLVVGAEKLRNGEVRLLVTEPTAACASVLTARSVKKRVAVVRCGESHPQWTSSPQYHVVYVDQVAKSESRVSRRYAAARRTQSFSGVSRKRMSFGSGKSVNEEERGG